MAGCLVEDADVNPVFHESLRERALDTVCLGLLIYLGVRRHGLGFEDAAKHVVDDVDRCFGIVPLLFCFGVGFVEILGVIFVTLFAAPFVDLVSFAKKRMKVRMCLSLVSFSALCFGVGFVAILGVIFVTFFSI